MNQFSAPDVQTVEADKAPQEAPDENQIEDLIAENLIDSLAILPEIDLANALHDFVDKVRISRLLASSAPSTLPHKRASSMKAYSHASPSFSRNLSLPSLLGGGRLNDHAFKFIEKSVKLSGEWKCKTGAA